MCVVTCVLFNSRLISLRADTAPKHLLQELADDAEASEDPFAATRKTKEIAARQSDYHNRRFNRDASGKAHDPFAEPKEGQQDGEEGGYREAMRRAELEREEARVQRKIQEAKENGDDSASQAMQVDQPDATPRRKRRWDVEEPATIEDPNAPVSTGEWSDAQPIVKKARSRWDQTPVAGGEGAVGATPKRSRWDQTPVGGAVGATPVGNLSMATPVGQYGMPSGIGGFAGDDLDKRNRPLSDEELDAQLPSEGYEIVEPPAGYAPIRTPARKLMQTPVGSGGFMMQEEGISASAMGMVPDLPTEIEGVGQLQFFKPEDAQYFGKILKVDDDESTLSLDELKERKIMRLLLKIKNGAPPMRKTALRQITDKAREFGAGPLFDKILPLLMERTLEDQERHLLVKVIDRILYKLDDLVRPYVHKILVVIEPLLIDEDYYARVEGREIISNLSKAAGLAHMISTMRPDIDHVDEYVRNTTARAFSVVASALGIPSLLPFLKAVCRSKKSWQARHTGIKIVQQIAIMMGCAVLPHLKNLVEAVAHGLEDEQQKVRTMTALSIAALAEAAAPYGIESFDSVLKPLWTGIRKHRGKGLAAFLKAIGFIIPLMDADYANYYTKEVMVRDG